MEVSKHSKQGTPVKDPVGSGKILPGIQYPLPRNLQNLGFDRRFSVSSSWDGTQGSFPSRSSSGGRSQRNSSESHGTIGGRRWKKQVKPTSRKPFKLRTEKRGRVKEEEFMKKIQEMTVEEEKLRIPIAQGLAWTTEEYEVLIKPHVKEIIRPVCPILCSDILASERSEFDHKVAEKMSLIRQYKMERARQDKMAEEEEIKRLRKELVPKAQLLLFFDRPFLPIRSSKNPTIPREPNFRMPQHKRTKSRHSLELVNRGTPLEDEKRDMEKKVPYVFCDGDALEMLAAPRLMLFCNGAGLEYEEIE
ncbi:uncharacterized protein LOC120199959 [Hibiscus syriacus]|uniref:uncharacterized protein LOC120199959 n=1 Tax=Hibiscus syriacus TaxID=106335 RepID=UPI0019224694|nr:uncharacterized protein LOC120199959 [Hibiscus syriacus]